MLAGCWTAARGGGVTGLRFEVRGSGVTGLCSGVGWKEWSGWEAEYGWLVVRWGVASRARVGLTHAKI